LVGVTWYEASAYCKWLQKHWNELEENQQNSALKPEQVRLPLETEWVQAAGGAEPPERFPWDLPGEVTYDIVEILRRTNVNENGLGRTTQVGMYPLGASPHGVWDMAGNAWELLANFSIKEDDDLVLRSGEWTLSKDFARLSCRRNTHKEGYWGHYGFRVCVLPS